MKAATSINTTGDRVADLRASATATPARRCDVLFDLRSGRFVVREEERRL